MIGPEDDDLGFKLDRGGAFFFKCHRCGVCCNNKRIRPTESEIRRMAESLKWSTRRFEEECLDRQTGELKVQPDGDCVFLGPEGCRVHPARPLVCRLFPLGVIWDDAGREKFGLMPPHPDCIGYYGREETVADYLLSQGADEGLAEERRLKVRVIPP